MFEAILSRLQPLVSQKRGTVRPRGWTDAVIFLVDESCGVPIDM